MTIKQHEGYIEVSVLLEETFETFDSNSEFYYKLDDDGFRRWIIGKNENGEHKLTFWVTDHVAQEEVDKLKRLCSLE